ncbi:MAG: radical SAM protein [Clostridia bacterium]|nr:radical SAM protein [Clostridia bacterium]
MNKTTVCKLCPRNCNAVRNENSGNGYCKMGTLPRIARVAPHIWEEPCISGTKGSGTIFFSGCVLSCVFCQNSKISSGGYGKSVTTEQLVDYIKKLESMGVHNINLVSPTPYIESIIECFERYKPSIPVVYNTGGYEKAETIKRLDGIVDIYLPDMKYINSDISLKYSKAADYFEYASEALKEMVRQTGKPQFDSDGIMTKGTIVRHLILPQNTHNSIEVLEWLDKTFGSDILISLMGQYIPLGNAGKYPEINRRITTREYNKVLDYLETTGLDGFVQELSSAKKSYIPDFDIEKL